MAFTTAIRRVGSFISFILVAILLASCDASQRDDSISFKALNVSPIYGQKTYERNLEKASLRLLFELPKNHGDSLRAPAGVVADTLGYIYVVDAGDYRIHRFDSSGNYKTSYGRGMGEGPGEIMGIVNLGVIGDSLFYVVDIGTKKTSYFDIKGPFLWSEFMEGGRHLKQYALTPEGRTYSMLGVQGNPERKLFESRKGDEAVRFGQIHGDIPYIFTVVAGNLVTFKEQMIYVFQWHPLFIQYSPDGSMKYARATVDYQTVGDPEILETSTGWKIDSIGLMGDFPTVHNGQLFIHANLAQTMDVYDAETGDYQHSIKLPENSFANALNDRIYQVGDSTVSVWAIE